MSLAYLDGKSRLFSREITVKTLFLNPRKLFGFVPKDFSFKFHYFFDFEFANNHANRCCDVDNNPLYTTVVKKPAPELKPL